MASTTVEQGRRGGHVVEGRQQIIELYGPCIRVIFLQCQTHGYAHEENLGQFQPVTFPVEEITVVEGLQAQEAKLIVPLRLEGSTQAFQVERRHGVIQQFVVDTLLNEAAQGLRVYFRQRQAEGQLEGGRGFQPQLFQQQTSGHGTVVRFLFDAATGGHDQGGQHLFLGNTVVQVPQRPFHQGFAIDALQSLTGTLHLDLHQPQIQRRGLTVGFFHR